MWSKSEVSFALLSYGFVEVPGPDGPYRFVREVDGVEIEVRTREQTCVIRLGDGEEMVSWDETIRRVVEELV